MDLTDKEHKAFEYFQEILEEHKSLRKKIKAREAAEKRFGRTSSGASEED